MKNQLKIQEISKNGILILKKCIKLKKKLITIKNIKKWKV